MRKPSASKGKLSVAPKKNSHEATVKKNAFKKLKSEASQSNGKTDSKNQKWAKLSLDEFINSGSEDNSSSFEDDTMNSSNEISDDEGEIEEEFSENDEEEEEIDEEEADDVNMDEEESDEGEDSDGDSDDKTAVEKHKKTLSSLKDTDPEFYKFLSENDQELLNFGSSDSEDDERGGKVHEPPKPEELEVGSDESDFEDAESAVKRQGNVVTQKIVDQWQQELQDPNCIKTIVDVVHAFRSAVHTVTEEKEGLTRFVVKGGAAFNAIVRLCIIDLIPAIKRVLKISKNDKIEKASLEKCKKWSKIRMHLKTYLADVIRLLGTLSESTIQSVILKHVHQLVPFYSAFVKLSRVLCKRLVTTWCSAEDTVRVLAFLSILRLARTLSNQLLEPIIKAMYLSYARNCKFTSPSTWPVINFMRRSLVELMALQEALTYKHAFLYIRQLAIHLRNGITAKKKDSILTVYNWQFVHCLHLWAALLGAIPDSQLLKPLLYPLVQIAIGTINLVPTTKYYPLRFHVVSILNQLSADTGTYIPAVSFLLEVLQNHKFDKKPSKASMKPLDLSCVLRVSQSQMGESGYRDAIVDLLYDHLLETLQCQSHSTSFPEIALPAILQLKKFIKKCSHPNYSKKLKQLLDKVQENIHYIEKQRSQVHFDLADVKAVLALENQIKQNGTPLTTYHTSWKKMRDREMAIKIAKKPENDKNSGVPTLKKPSEKTKVNDSESENELNELFPSDSSDDDDDENRFLLKEERETKSNAKDTKKTLKKVEERKKVEETEKKMNGQKKERAKVVPKEAEEMDGEDIADQVEDFDMFDEESDDEINGDEVEDSEDEIDGDEIDDSEEDESDEENDSDDDD